jgi:hypothetical protein
MEGFQGCREFIEIAVSALIMSVDWMCIADYTV